MAPLVANALWFLVLGDKGFNGYLLVSTFETPYFNHLIIYINFLVADIQYLGGNRVTGRSGRDNSNYSLTLLGSALCIEID